MKISEVNSEEIYRLAKDPRNKLSNCEIARRLHTSEAVIRYHIKRQEEKRQQITIANTMLSKSIQNYDLNVRAEALSILSEVRQSIELAKSKGTSPERLSGLYGTWLKSLELAAELIGQRKPLEEKKPNIVGIYINYPTGSPRKIEKETIEAEAKPLPEPAAEALPVIESSESPIPCQKSEVSEPATPPCTCFTNGAKRYKEYIGCRCTTCGGIIS